MKIMKKVLFVAVAVLTLASCKKDWTCECQYAEGYNNSYKIVNKTKRQATNICEDKVTVGVITVGGNHNCALK